MKNYGLLEKLSNANSIASYEDEVRNILYKNISANVDDTYTDKLGSIIFEKKGKKNSPKIMICAHMDEVGFKVRHIAEDGKIFLKHVGGMEGLAVYSQPAIITTFNNNKICGVIVSDYEKNTTKVISTYINIGAKSNKDVEKLGIEVGNMVTFDSKFKYMNTKDKICGKAFDDRIGCYVLAKLAKKLANKETSNNLYFVGTSSEEVGIRGAKTSSSLINPDVAIIIDTTVFPKDNCTNENRFIKDNKGICITYFDKGIEANPKFVKYTIDIAKKQKIQYQFDQFDNGATDAAAINLNNCGCPCIALCVPLTFIHTSYSIVNTKLIDDAVELTYNMILNLNSSQCRNFVKFI